MNLLLDLFLVGGFRRWLLFVHHDAQTFGRILAVFVIRVFLFVLLFGTFDLDVVLVLSHIGYLLLGNLYMSSHISLVSG